MPCLQEGKSLDQAPVRHIHRRLAVFLQMPPQVCQEIHHALGHCCLSASVLPAPTWLSQIDRVVTLSYMGYE